MDISTPPRRTVQGHDVHPFRTGELKSAHPGNAFPAGSVFVRVRPSGGADADLPKPIDPMGGVPTGGEIKSDAADREINPKAPRNWTRAAGTERRSAQVRTWSPVGIGRLEAASKVRRVG